MRRFESSRPSQLFQQLRNKEGSRRHGGAAADLRPPIRSDRSKMNGPLNHRDWGKPRLFPRSFIISLPAPSNYVGPDLVFGSNHEDGMEAPCR